MYSEGGSEWIKSRVADPKQEDAAAKLWAVYVAEAEKYDKGLVESWKSDMEGMLIFAGLFSASLTAFLIESYRTLTVDSADTTVFLLNQISQQLAASANGTTYNIVPPVSFVAPPTALVCNVLWFISLGLSLGCALIATLVEQWARDFLHRADMRSAPVVRARIFSYLYYGLKRFEMHTMVEIIPLLLHTSLLFFFAGLVAFLLPVNTAIMVVAAGLLGIVAAVYSLLTVLPLIYLDCPYRTPLSQSLWTLKRRLTNRFRAPHAAKPDEARAASADHSDDTIVESMFRKATEASPERLNRDQKALLWTVKSLADDTELEPFVDAIPDVLYAPDGRRYVYDEQIFALVKHPDTKLLLRIHGSYIGCFSGILTAESAKRRKISCCRATWTISSLPAPGDFGEHALFIDPSLCLEQDEDVLYYAVSASAMGRWGNFRNAYEPVAKHLTLCQSAVAEGVIPDVTHLAKSLHAVKRPMYFPHAQEVDGYIDRLHGHTSLPDIAQIIREISAMAITTPFSIMLEYLLACAGMKSAPYEFNRTQEIIFSPWPFRARLPRSRLFDLESGLETVVYDHIQELQTEEAAFWIDEIVTPMLSYFCPEGDEYESLRLPWALVIYLALRKSSDAIGTALSRLPNLMWSSVEGTIRHGPSLVARSPPSLGDIGGYDITLLTALWKMYRHTHPKPGEVRLETWEAVLDAISNFEAGAIHSSVTAMAKWALLKSLDRTSIATEDQILRFSPHIIPAEKAIPAPAEPFNDEDYRWRTGLGYSFIQARQTDGMLHVLTEYIERCCLPGGLPFNAAETIATIGAFTPMSVPHATVQMRFAVQVRALFETLAGVDGNPRILCEFVKLQLLDAYLRDSANIGWTHKLVQWLNPESLLIVRDTLGTYLHEYEATIDSLVHSRLHTLVLSLNEPVNTTV
ncbi:hypothetical protein DFH06DRAFT_1197688 [Mycena polygramma]|nr:hypothetical protein DFH06DRAFT_1197688 [Mycena polygramma]